VRRKFLTLVLSPSSAAAASAAAAAAAAIATAIATTDSPSASQVADLSAMYEKIRLEAADDSQACIHRSIFSPRPSLCTPAVSCGILFLT
jgi:hypothetical protein